MLACCKWKSIIICMGIGKMKGKKWSSRLACRIARGRTYLFYKIIFTSTLFNWLINSYPLFEATMKFERYTFIYQLVWLCLTSLLSMNFFFKSSCCWHLNLCIYDRRENPKWVLDYCFPPQPLGNYRKHFLISRMDLPCWLRAKKKRWEQRRLNSR